MQQPIDYRLAVQNPLESFTSGYKQMAGILDYQDAMAADKQKQLEAQQAAQQQAAERQAMNNDLHAVLSDPNADLHKASLELTIKHPGLSKQVQDALTGLGDDQKKDRVQKLTPIYTAALSGNAALVNSQADALIAQAEQSGQKRLSDEYRAQKAHYNADPNSWMLSTGLVLNGLDPKTMEAVGASIKNKTDMQTQPFTVEQESQKTRQSQYLTSSAQSKAVIDAAKANVAALSEQLGLAESQAKIDQINASIAAENAKIRQEEQKIAQEGQKIANAQNAVPDKKPEVIKLITEASNDATALNDQMGRALDLANKFDAMKGSGWGVGTSWSDALRKATGFNGDDTALRDEFTRSITPDALTAYKASVGGGNISDSDVKKAFAGWPDADSNPEQIASFLRGRAKILQMQAVRADLKTQWLSANDHPGTLARDTVINGVTVPAGQTFDQFLKFYLPRRLEFLKKTEDAEKEGKSALVNRKPDAPEVKKPAAQKTAPASIPRPVVTVSPFAAINAVNNATRIR
jgi:hypothetical protein